MDKLLTKSDLATRWQVSEQAIDDYRVKGIIQAVKGLPSVRFNPQHIAEIEGTKLEKFSPIERKKMEREIEELRFKLSKAEDVISKFHVLITEHIFWEKEEKSSKGGY